MDADLSFWNASGVSIKMGADGVEFRMELLCAVPLGGIAFETPPVAGSENCCQ